MDVTEGCSYLIEFYCYSLMIEQRLKAKCQRTKMGQYNWNWNARELKQGNKIGNGMQED